MRIEDLIGNTGIIMAINSALIFLLLIVVIVISIKAKNKVSNVIVDEISKVTFDEKYFFPVRVDDNILCPDANVGRCLEEKCYSHVHHKGRHFCILYHREFINFEDKRDR